MMDSMGFNRRMHARVNIGTELSLVLVDAKSAGILDGKERIHLHRGTISDLSAAGMQVKVSDLAHGWHFHLLSGSIAMAVRFTLPGVPKPISLVANVARIIPDGEQGPDSCSLGLKFVEVSPENKTAIETFIQSVGSKG
jgi:c-di-GMP-binding flagellar brake protein YcgR